MQHPSAILLTAVVALGAGTLIQVIAHHLKFPAIALLLLAGVGLGPAGLGFVDPNSFGEGFEPVISLAVAIVLFEGGLTLDLEGLRLAPRIIRRLITSGVLITWLATAALAMVVLDLDLPVALLTGSLVIVTGPTVVTPLLRRIGVEKRLNHILHWEAVLIDPIGVFVALVCFEWVILIAENPGATMVEPLVGFAIRIVAGTAIGVGGGFLLTWALRRHWVPSDHANIAVLTGALTLYGVADLMLPHTGILAVTIAGLVLGWQRPPQLRSVRDFKLEMTELAVGFLFILLAADLQIESFTQLGVGGIVVIAAVMFVIRPLVIVVATWGEALSLREKVFLSWLAPRGIVAASMASLFAYELARTSMPSASIVEPFTFAVIGATVLLQGSSAGVVARLMGVRQTARRGWLIVGARALGLSVAKALERHDVPVVILDQNADAIVEAKQRGLSAILGDAIDPTIADDPRLAEIGHMLCATDNPAINDLLADRWGQVLGEQKVHTWHDLCSGRELGQDISAVDVDESFAMPAVVSRAIEVGELVIRPVSSSSEAEPNGRVLFTLGQGRATPNKVGALAPDGARLMLGWRGAGKSDLFKNVARLDGADLKACYRHLLEHTASAELELDVEDCMRQLVGYVAVLGNSVAIAHVNVEVSKPLCVVGVLPDEIEVSGSRDRAQVVCLLVSPMDAPASHLEALAQIAAWASNSGRVRSLLDASSLEQQLATLNAYDPGGATLAAVSLPGG